MVGEFHVEDTCALQNDRSLVGIIDRTFGDVDSHDADPEGDYRLPINYHADIATEQVAAFKKSGIPPHGTVVVLWQSKPKIELLPEKELILLDRALLLGDVVRRDAQSVMSGTVVSTVALATVAPLRVWSDLPSRADEQDAAPIDLSHQISNVPAAELKPVQEFSEGDIILYNGWLGRVDECLDDITIRLKNNSIVTIDEPESLETLHGEDRISVGDVVTTKKGNLRRGTWKFGAYDPHLEPVGIVVDVRTAVLSVHWLCRKVPNSEESSTYPPRNDLLTEDIENGSLCVYDRGRTPGQRESKASFELVVGKRVRFKDLSGACMKYDGTRFASNGEPMGQLKKVPRTETLGYDTNVFSILSTHTEVTVKWQDLSVTTHKSIDLIPDVNVDDEDEVWPGEIVCSRQTKTAAAAAAAAAEAPADRQQTDDWIFEPAKVGVVQSVRAADRMAKVRWMPSSSVLLAGEVLLPGSHTGPVEGPEQEISLYDITSHPGLNTRRGDLVLLLRQTRPDDMLDPESSRVNTPSEQAEEFDWLGEVIDLGLDGLFTIRLGAMSQVRDVKLRPEDVIVAYGDDTDSIFDEADSTGSDDEYDDDIDTEDEMSIDDEDPSRYDIDTYNDTWYEWQGVEEDNIDPTNGNEDWLTEEEDHSSSSEMEDKKDVDTPMTEVKQSETEYRVMPRDVPDDLAQTTSGPPFFAILETSPPSDHHFIECSSVPTTQFIRRIGREQNILNQSLPEGVYVRAWESRLDLLRVLFIGPVDTPYEFAPFVIDFYLPPSYPNAPPDTYFHSWTGGTGPVNPNLYEDGKICLSLLGTWPADARNETWSPGRSTLLQVIVSILGLVLVKEPYYNEAGYDVRYGSEATRLPSALYSERTYFRTRAFITHALTHSVAGLEDELHWLYRETSKGSPRLLDKAIEAARAIIEDSESTDLDGIRRDEKPRDGLRRISAGAAIQLRRQLNKMEALRQDTDVSNDTSQEG